MARDANAAHVTAIPLGRRLPGASSDLPGRPDPDTDPGPPGLRRTVRAGRMSRFKRRPASRYVHRLEGDGVETVWTSRGDRVKIMALRAQVSPASAAGHAMLSPRTKWDIRGIEVEE